MAKKNLVEIIKANPGCVAIIDNDQWTLYKADPTEENDGPDNELASSDDYLEPMAGSTYQEDNCYGGGLLRALAVIVGVKLESV